MAPKYSLTRDYPITNLVWLKKNLTYFGKSYLELFESEFLAFYLSEHLTWKIYYFKNN